MENCGLKAEILCVFKLVCTQIISTAEKKITDRNEMEMPGQTARGKPQREWEFAAKLRGVSAYRVESDADKLQKTLNS